MAHHSTEAVQQEIRSAREELQSRDELPFAELLCEEVIQEALKSLGVEFRQRVFTPITTVWTFLSQVVSTDQSCRQAVARVNACRVAQGQQACSPDNTSYCQARLRLPEALLPQLTRRVAEDCEEQARQGWLWKGRSVKIADGSTLTMPDTPENEAEFGKPGGQKAGLGFPMTRILVVFSLAAATVLEAAIGPCRGKRTGENSLFRTMFDAFHPGDVVLGDKLFDCYADIARLRGRGVDVVFSKNQSRRCDFRRGSRLGKHDHLIVWHRPKFDSSRFTREEYDALPETMLMREVRITVQQKGFRPDTITVVTTLTDATEYSHRDIADLYYERWHCELDLKSLKSSMQMGELSCKTPEMIQKEFWAYLLAYNLLRQMMMKAAEEHGQLPRRLSFKGAMQTVKACAPYLSVADAERHAKLRAHLLKAIASHRVGNRPGRKEPRKVKRRKAKYSYLTVPRHQAREENDA